MSESIGVLGQRYENRRTKKSGVLLSRDEDKKILQFLDDETGEPFSVSESSFRSNWRKAVEAEVVEPEANDVNEESENNVTEFATEKDAIQNFIDVVSGQRNIHFDHNPFKSDITEMTIDGITALMMCKDDGGIRVKMLPDLYIYSGIKNHVVAGTLHFEDGAHLAVSFVADFETMGDVLQSVKEAVIDINLYGYTTE